jgi:acyl-CoA reductase-like NAD-dependent aldehyde dehydrogenase
MMLAGGNSVVFSPHPTAKKVSAHVVRLLNRALVAEGAPANLAVCVADPTIQTAEEMFRHPKVAILSITGGPAVVQAAMRASKKVIAAGPGNPPVVVDETADLALAAAKITQSASFDNNVLCFAEKEIFVVETVFDRFMEEMRKAGNVRLDPGQIERLAEKAFEKKKHLRVLNRELAGRNANVIATAIGLRIGEEVPLLFGETGNDHVFVQEEQLMPFLPVIRCRGWEEAVERALVAEHGYGHSAGIYTADMKRATLFAGKANTSIFVINGGHHQGDGGPEGEGTLSFTIATPTGEAITRPRHFCRKRRIMIAGSMRFV